MTTTTVDYRSAPKDYDELFRIYYHFVVNLVHKHGISDENKEDVASEILTRFIERGFLEKFNPDLVFEYKGQLRPARFKSFLSKFVLRYIPGHCDKQHRLQRREWFICDMPVTSPGDGAEERRWVDVYGSAVNGHEDAVLEVMVEATLAEQLRAHLVTVPRRSPGDQCNLPALFDAVRAQCMHTGGIDIKALKDLFGVSSTAMHTWVWWLKANIADYLGLPMPAKRARRNNTVAATVEP